MKAMGPPHRDVDARDGDEPVCVDGLAETIRCRDAAPALEFVCWIVVVLAPLLRWVNGPAVTDDQFYIQCAIVVLAVVGAICLRLYNWRSGQSQRE